mgnify:CR=1 FL=1
MTKRVVISIDRGDGVDDCAVFDDNISDEEAGFAIVALLYDAAAKFGTDVVQSAILAVVLTIKEKKSVSKH